MSRGETCCWWTKFITKLNSASLLLEADRLDLLLIALSLRPHSEDKMMDDWLRTAAALPLRRVTRGTGASRLAQSERKRIEWPQVQKRVNL